MRPSLVVAPDSTSSKVWPSRTECEVQPPGVPLPMRVSERRTRCARGPRCWPPVDASNSLRQHLVKQRSACHRRLDGQPCRIALEHPNAVHEAGEVVPARDQIPTGRQCGRPRKQHRKGHEFLTALVPRPARCRAPLSMTNAGGRGRWRPSSCPITRRPGRRSG